MSKIMKEPEKSQVQSYDFFAGFLLKEEEKNPAEGTAWEDAEQEAEESETDVRCARILEDAKRQARQIVLEAREQAELLRKEAFEEGRSKGEQEGRSEERRVGKECGS